MNKWFAAVMVALASTLSHAADDWVDRELKDVSKQFNGRHFGLAFEMCHNLLLIHRAAPLDRDAADQAKTLLGRLGQWVKAANPKVFTEEFVARAKGLGFVQAGCAWMPAEAKAKLSADATARLEKLAQAEPCATCKGACITPCLNCQRGIVKCMACMGTGQAAGGGAVTRAICPVCNGQGKSRCTFCRGSGFVACPKCNGSGLGE
jgi:hypothetical protein